MTNRIILTLLLPAFAGFANGSPSVSSSAMPTSAIPLRDDGKIAN